MLMGLGTAKALLIAIFAVVCLLFVLKRMVRAVIGVLIVAVFAPIVLAILLGDGESYIESLTRFLPERQQEIVLEGYSHFHDKEGSDPVVDYGKVKEAMNSLTEQAVYDIKQRKADSWLKKAGLGQGGGWGK